MNYLLIVITESKVVLDCAIIYILLIIEHNEDISPENGLGEVGVDKTTFIKLYYVCVSVRVLVWHIKSHPSNSLQSSRI